MNFSAPIHKLKRQAKLLSREQKLPLHLALDFTAKQEGFTSWSHLAAHAAAFAPAERIYEELAPGDLALIAALPGQGKTLISLAVAIRAAKEGRKSFFFSLEYSEKEVLHRLESLGYGRSAFQDRLSIDLSDDISAAYIDSKLEGAPSGAVAVIDYLQLLDQNRAKPSLDDQLRKLSMLAAKKRASIVCLSQVNRGYDPSARRLPGLSDLRLPNPVNLGWFSLACYLHGGRFEVERLRERMN